MFRLGERSTGLVGGEGKGTYCLDHRSAGSGGKGGYDRAETKGGTSCRRRGGDVDFVAGQDKLVCVG